MTITPIAAEHETTSSRGSQVRLTAAPTGRGRVAIVPSLLDVDFGRLGEEVMALEQAGAGPHPSGRAVAIRGLRDAASAATARSSVSRSWASQEPQG